MGEIEKLRAFAQAVIGQNGFDDLDGSDLQELSVKHGLLEPIEMTAPCSEDACSCYECGADFPTTCYRKTRLLKGETDGKKSSND